MAVIKLIGLSTGEPNLHDGEYVVEYNPTDCLKTGAIILRTTPKKEDALQFPTAMDAIAYWQWAEGTRPDGKPNRPLTAWTVEIN